MKLTIILIFLGVMKVSASAYSQNAKLVLNFHQVSVEQLLEEIKSQSDFTFLYRSDLIKKLPKVNINEKEASLEKILDQVLVPYQLTYEIYDNTVVIRKDKSKKNDETRIQLKNISREIKGKVTEENGEPLPGAVVLEKGTSNGSVTDIDGNFSISVADDAILQISFVGYEMQEITVAGRTSISVSMQPDLGSLEEVVVIGYGEQKKATLTGAVEVVSAKAFEDRAVTNPALALQGETPGLVITRSSSRPGREGINMQIRGATSVNGGSPLIIIDGSPVINDEAFYSLNPDDIESISVLKDGSAAIYGSRASNGVILVTTKRGKSGKISVSLSSNLRVNTIGIRPPTPTMQDYATVWLDATDQDGDAAYYWGWMNRENLLRMQRGESGIYQTQFWGDIFMANSPRFDEMYGTSVSNQQNLNITGGTDKSTYRLSLGYAENIGNLVTAYDGKTQYNIRLNNDFKVSDKIRFETGIAYFGTNLSSPSGGLDVTSIAYDPPFFPAKNPYGDWYANFGVAGNRNSVANTVAGGRDNQSFNQLKLNAMLTYDITKDLSFRATGSIDKEFWNQDIYRIRVPQYTWFGELAPESVNTTPSYERRMNTINYETYGTFLNYSKTLMGNHNFSAMIGSTAELRRTRDLRGYRQGFEDNGVYDLNVAAPDLEVLNSGGSSHWGLFSYVGRINYNYQNKYLLEFQGRRDGSSKFHKDYRWLNFGGLSAGWVLTEERFLKNVKGLDFLKLKASYGDMGGQVGIGNHDYVSSMILNTAVFGTTVGNNQAGSYVAQLTSFTRTWERIGMANYGIELETLGGKLSFTADYFTKKNEGMLIPINYPQVLGGTAPPTNSGTLEVRGWEAVVSYRDMIGDLKYNLRFNIGDTRNKVTHMEGVNTFVPGLNATVQGYPINSYFLYQTDGFFANEAEILAYYEAYGSGGEIPDRNNQEVALRPGDTRKIDVDGSGIIRGAGSITDESGDVKYMGDATPHYTFGFNLGLQFKNFDLSTLFQGSWNHNVVRTGWLSYPFNTIWANQTSGFIGQTWTPENPDAEFPRMTGNGVRAAWNWGNNDFMMLNNRYVRMKTLIVGYTLSGVKVGKLDLDRCRVFFSGNDLFEFTSIKDGFDPEFGESTHSSYPFNRTYSFGFNVTF